MVVVGDARLSYTFRDNLCILQVEKDGQTAGKFTTSHPNHHQAMAWALAKVWGIRPPAVEFPVFSRQQNTYLMVSLTVDSRQITGEAPISDHEHFAALVNAFETMRPLFTAAD